MMKNRIKLAQLCFVVFLALNSLMGCNQMRIKNRTQSKNNEESKENEKLKNVTGEEEWDVLNTNNTNKENKLIVSKPLSNSFKPRKLTKFELKYLWALQQDKPFGKFLSKVDDVGIEIAKTLGNLGILEKVPNNLYNTLYRTWFYRGGLAVQRKETVNEETQFWKLLKEGKFKNLSLYLLPICFKDYPLVDPGNKNRCHRGLIKRADIEIRTGLEKHYPHSSTVPLSKQLNLKENSEEALKADELWHAFYYIHNWSMVHHPKWLNIDKDGDIHIERYFKKSKWNDKIFDNHTFKE